MTSVTTRDKRALVKPSFTLRAPCINRTIDVQRSKKRSTRPMARPMSKKNPINSIDPRSSPIPIDAHWMVSRASEAAHFAGLRQASQHHHPDQNASIMTRRPVQATHQHVSLITHVCWHLRQSQRSFAIKTKPYQLAKNQKSKELLGARQC